MQSKPILGILAVVLVFFIWGVVGFIGKARETSRNKQIAEDKIAQLQKEKDKLSADITKLKTDQGIEESIREKFGLAKEGEGMIVVVDDKTTSPTEASNSSGSFWGFFRNWFR